MRTPDYVNQLARVGEHFLFNARVVRTYFKKGVRTGEIIFNEVAYPATKNAQGIWEATL